MTNLERDSAMYTTLNFMNYNRPFDTCQTEIRRDFNDDATQLANHSRIFFFKEIKLTEFSIVSYSKKK